MPVVIKEIQQFPAGDGFDPDASYQMVPFGGTRDIAVQTGDFDAELELPPTNITAMSNFRILQQSGPNPLSLGLPGPGLRSLKVKIPSRSIVQFTLHGDAVGNIHLLARDLPSGAAPLKPDFDLLVGVKPNERRNFAVCHLFDTVNRDIGRRPDVSSWLPTANNVFERQANFTIVDTAPRAAHTLTMPGSSGKVFNFRDKKLVGRLVRQLELQLPTVVAQNHAIVMSLKVPISTSFMIKGKKKVVSPWAYSMFIERESDKKHFTIILVTPNRPGEAPMLETIVPHEIGHTLGLDHFPEQEPIFPKHKAPDPRTLPFWMHNLMFPTVFIRSGRLNALHIEILHYKYPVPPVLFI